MPQIAAITEVLPLLYLHGLSSQDFVPALQQFRGTSCGLSASVITRLTVQWQDEARAFAGRDLSGADYDCPWADGVHLNQRCWFHKVANVLGALPKSARPWAEKALAEIWNAEDLEHARRAVAAFKLAYGAKFGKAIAKVVDDLDELLAFHDFPAEHWVHLRTTNPIESTFATVRHRTEVTKGPGSKTAAVAMAFKRSTRRTPSAVALRDGRLRRRPPEDQTEMTAEAPARRPALLIDIGGVLISDYLTAAAAAWGSRLGIAPQAFLAALFAGNDDQILIGRASEAAWWAIIADRLHVDEKQIAAIRADLAARQTWNTTLLNGLHHIRSRATITIVSNAWPDIRTGMADAGLLDLADSVVLSCEVGYAKPDPRIYALALHSVRADPADALFIDDTLEHVNAARPLGMTGHLHTHTGETLTRIEKFVERSPRRSPA